MAATSGQEDECDAVSVPICTGTWVRVLPSKSCFPPLSCLGINHFTSRHFTSLLLPSQPSLSMASRGQARAATATRATSQVKSSQVKQPSQRGIPRHPVCSCLYSHTVALTCPACPTTCLATCRAVPDRSPPNPLPLRPHHHPLYAGIHRVSKENETSIHPSIHPVPSSVVRCTIPFTVPYAPIHPPVTVLRPSHLAHLARRALLPSINSHRNMRRLHAL